LFVKSQALDNISPDLCVIDGVILEARALEVRPHLARIAEICIEGKESREGSTRFWQHKDDVAIEICTMDVDEAGRAAPLLAMFDWASARDAPRDLAGELTVLAQSINRHVEPDRLARDLIMWVDRRPSGNRHAGCRASQRWLAIGVQRSLKVIRDSLRASVSEGTSEHE
jgi:hypothetical protein